jgi:hypothetical protein
VRRESCRHGERSARKAVLTAASGVALRRALRRALRAEHGASGGWAEHTRATTSAPGRARIRGVRRHLLHERGEEGDLLGLDEDDEGGREVEQCRMLPQHARANRVERPRPHLIHPAVRERADTQPELLGGVVGEGDDEDGGAVLALVEEIGEACAEHARFPRARRREEQHRIARAADGLELQAVWHRPLLECGIELAVHARRRPAEARKRRARDAGRREWHQPQHAA